MVRGTRTMAGEYRDIVINSMKHCQEKKGLEIYGWCIMSNHVHLIISAEENNVSDVLGDVKKYTSKKIIKAIKEHPGESRREWMLKIFKEAGEQNSRNDSYQFWIQDNQPKIIYTEAFGAQCCPEKVLKKKYAYCTVSTTGNRSTFIS